MYAIVFVWFFYGHPMIHDTLSECEAEREHVIAVYEIAIGKDVGMRKKWKACQKWSTVDGNLSLRVYK